MAIITRVFSTALLIAISSFYLESISGTKVEKMPHKLDKHENRVERNARRQHNIPMVLDPGAAAVENTLQRTGEIKRKEEKFSTTNFAKPESVSNVPDPTTKKEISRIVMNEALSTTNLVKAEPVITTLNPSTKKEISRTVMNEALPTTNLVKAESVSTTLNPSTIMDPSSKTTYEEETESYETDSTKTTKSAKEGRKLQAEIQKITLTPNQMTANISDAYSNTSSIINVSKDDITEKPDLKRQNETKIMSLNGEQIKVCLGVLSQTNSCNYSVSKCENSTNWLGEIVEKNNSNIFNIRIQIKSLWSDLARINNSCNDSNNTDQLVHIIFTKEQVQSQTKQRINTIFYKDTIAKTDEEGDDKLCLPAGQCIQLWIATVEPNVSSCNIEMIKNVEPEVSIPDWVMALSLYAMYCTFYIAVWVNCPTCTK